MTGNDDDDDYRDLERLFESTRAEPSAFELTRMAARARELPARLERVPRRLPRWSLAPAFGALAALGALGVTLTQAFSSGEPASSPSASPAVTAPVTGTAKAPHDRSARPTSPSTAEPAAVPRPSADEGDFDGLSLTPEADDDPFDLSIHEEMELSR